MAVGLLLASSVAWAEPNPADHPLTVHVVGSANRGGAAVLDVVIDGKPYELLGVQPMGGLLQLGDYQARSVPVVHGYNRGIPYASYDSWTTYEFYFPVDGQTRRYDVDAMGTAVSRN